MALLLFVRRAVAETWKDLLTQKFPEGNPPSDDDVLEGWKVKTVAQVQLVFGKHVEEEEVPEQDIRTWIDEALQEWKQTAPLAAAKAPTAGTLSSSSAAPTSFSLFATLGGGGSLLGAFFSWPMIAESESEQEIWQGLAKVEYLDDVWPDWSSEIRPWIQKRMLQSDDDAVNLHRQWYGKARRQESPETTLLSLDLMENVFTALTEASENSSTSEKTQFALLELGLDMFTDYLVRKGDCPPIMCLASLWKASFSHVLIHALAKKDPKANWLRLFLQTHPSLYRTVGTTLDISLLAQSMEQSNRASKLFVGHQKTQYFYSLAILSNLLAVVRVRGFPWKDWKTLNSTSSSKDQVHQLLWAAVRDPEAPHRELYAEGLASSLAGSDGNRVSVFREEFASIKDEHYLMKDLKTLQQYMAS